MSESRWRGTPPPTAPPVPTYRVLRPQRDGPLDVTLLDESVFGVACHYYIDPMTGKGETRVCTYHEGECPYHDSRAEWTGFIAAYDHKANVRIVLRLAPKEALALEKAIGREGRWAGRRLTITPVNRGQGREIVVSHPDTQVGAAKLPPHAIERTICLVMGCDHVPQQGPTVEDVREGGAP